MFYENIEGYMKILFEDCQAEQIQSLHKPSNDCNLKHVYTYILFIA
jgi:hypothetical protein